jgi:hypothetical protein
MRYVGAKLTGINKCFSSLRGFAPNPNDVLVELSVIASPDPLGRGNLACKNLIGLDKAFNTKATPDLLTGKFFRPGLFNPGA